MVVTFAGSYLGGLSGAFGLLSAAAGLGVAGALLRLAKRGGGPVVGAGKAVLHG